MILPMRGIHEYMLCPFVYMFKYVNGIECGPSASSQMSGALHSVISWFYTTSIFSGKPPSYDDLRSKWEQTWFSGMTAEDYLLSTNAEHREAGTQGFAIIDRFYRSLPYCSVLAAGDDYEVPLGGHTVTGSIDLIREVPEGSRRIIEIVDYRYSNKPADRFLIDQDLDLTVQSYAVRYNYRVSEQRIVVHYLRTGEEVRTIRTDSHYTRAGSIIRNVGKSISNRF